MGGHIIIIPSKNCKDIFRLHHIFQKNHNISIIRSFLQIIFSSSYYIMLSHRGNHTFGDFVFDESISQDELKLLATNIFKAMETCIRRTSMKIVHKQLVILGDDENIGTTPAGFTSVLLLDESHCSAHCYSDDGLLALDVFTCGLTDPKKIMEDIEQEIKLIYPTFRCIFNGNHKRFHH